MRISTTSTQPTTHSLADKTYGRKRLDATVARQSPLPRGLRLKTTSGGGQRWVLDFHHRKRHFRKVIGDATVMPLEEAWAIARTAMADIRSGRRHQLILPQEMQFPAAGRFLLNAYSRHWKPVTRAGSERSIHDRSCRNPDRS